MSGKPSKQEKATKRVSFLDVENAPPKKQPLQRNFSSITENEQDRTQTPASNNFQEILGPQLENKGKNLYAFYACCFIKIFLFSV